MNDKENIDHNEKLFRILLLYYLDELGDVSIESEILNSPNQRETINSYIAAWSELDEKVQAYINKNFAGEP